MRNYRTIGTEQTIELGQGMTIVGANNTGKTNLLRAIELVFTGHENLHGYDRARDLTFNAGAKARTSLSATFDGDPGVERDLRIYEQLDELHTLLGSQRAGTTFALSLQFSESSTPSYQFFPNAKKPAEGALRTQYSRVERRLTAELLGSFECHYVPSAKSISALYADLLVPFLRRLAAKAIEPHFGELQSALDEVADRMNEGLAKVGLPDLKASFAFPGGSHERLFHGFDLNLADPDQTPIDRKGQGIQSTALLASFLWIAREEAVAGQSTIWLLEEPESYLHPELSHSCRRLLDELRRDSLVVATTHSLSFVPQDPQRVSGTELVDRRTIVNGYRTYSEATAAIRLSLGIRFGDYYNLDTLNILVEGPSDRELIAWAGSLLDEGGEPPRWQYLKQAQVMDFGGVKHLAGFLRATYGFIRAERPVVAVFDGDDAGSKERKDLQRYFGQRDIPFEANRDFVSVRDRFAIEGLFPDDWIVDLHEEHPAWFEVFSVDVSGTLEPFRLKDSAKAQVQRDLVERAGQTDPSDWDDRWVDLLTAMDDALRLNAQRLAVEDT